MNEADGVTRCQHCGASLFFGGKHAARCPLRPPDLDALSAKVDAIAEGLAFLLRRLDKLSGGRFDPSFTSLDQRNAKALADKLEGK